MKEALPSGKPQEKTERPRRKRFGLKNHHRAPARFLFQRGALHSAEQCSRTKRFALPRRGHSGGATCPPGLAGVLLPRSASVATAFQPGSASLQRIKNNEALRLTENRPPEGSASVIAEVPDPNGLSQNEALRHSDKVEVAAAKPTCCGC